MKMRDKMDSEIYGTHSTIHVSSVARSISGRGAWSNTKDMSVASLPSIRAPSVATRRTSTVRCADTCAPSTSWSCNGSESPGHPRTRTYTSYLLMKGCSDTCAPSTSWSCNGSESPGRPRTRTYTSYLLMKGCSRTYTFYLLMKVVSSTYISYLLIKTANVFLIVLYN